jgi:hypothetical protein
MNVSKNMNKEADAATGELDGPLMLARRKGAGGKVASRKGRGGSPAHPLVSATAGAYRRAGVTKLLHEINDDSILTARLTYPGANVTTSVTGTIVTTSLFAASNVRTVCTEFTSYNLRYDLYRVIALRVHFMPRYFSAIAGALPPASAWLCVNFENQAAVSQSDVLASAYFAVKSFSRPFTYDAIPANNSDCWLWTGTNSTIATASDYQISWCSGFQGDGTASIVIGHYFVEVVCQFTRRG